MDPQEVLQLLKDMPSLGLIEAYHVTTFKGHRTKQDGSTQQSFTLTILDAGPTLHAGARYSCQIETEDGLKLRGNPSDTLIGALYIVQGLH